MNKASGGDGIPVELFQILKGDAMKVLHSIREQIWKTQQWPQDWKRSVFIPIPKNAQTTAQLHSSHMLVKQCSKFSKPGFNSMWTVNFQIFKLALEKAEEPETKLPTFTGSSKKQESSRKTSAAAAAVASVVSNSVRPHRQQPTRLLHHPRDSPGKDAGVGCHFLLQQSVLGWKNP